MELPRLGDLTNSRESRDRARALTTSAISKAVARKTGMRPADIVAGALGSNKSYLLPLVEKSTTPALLTTDQGFDDTTRPLDVAWADLVRRTSLLGRMAAAVRNVLPYAAVTVVDTGTAASFVTEGEPTPVVRQTLTDKTLGASKISVITPYSLELARATFDRLATLIERDHSRSIAIAEDTALLDGAAAVTGGRPASILNGLTPLSGGTAADIEADVLALMAAVRDGDFAFPFFLTSPAGSRYLMGLRNSGGDRVFPNVTAIGGTIHGIQVLISVGSPDILALVDADAILVVDGNVQIDITQQAALQFNSTPAAGAQNVTSLWGTDSFAVKAERFIGWRLAWADGAAFMTLPTGSPS